MHTAFQDEWLHGAAAISCEGRPAMKTMISALLALSVLAGIAGSANALDAKTFYEEQERHTH
jgi:hypothetical protein